MTAKKDDTDIAAILEEEAEAIDADRDAPITKSTVTRGNGRSKTLQIRLNPEELEELERIAARRGLPVSTVAREAILHLIRPGLARSTSVQQLVEEFGRYLDLIASAQPEVTEEGTLRRRSAYATKAARGGPDQVKVVYNIQVGDLEGGDMVLIPHVDQPAGATNFGIRLSKISGDEITTETTIRP